jgi:ABC-type transport system involved in Fe-S cluster assembly fused permease/ATPase subunit
VQIACGLLRPAQVLLLDEVTVRLVHMHVHGLLLRFLEISFKKQLSCILALRMLPITYAVKVPRVHVLCDLCKSSRGVTVISHQ